VKLTANIRVFSRKDLGMPTLERKNTIACIPVLLAVTCWSSGCSGDGTTKISGKPPKQETHDEHPEHGPHGGELAEWGDHEFHVEVTVDKKDQSATAYILDAAAKNAVPIAVQKVTLTLKQPIAEFTLAAAPQESDPQGASSRFTGKHAALATADEVAGTVAATVSGKPYAGDFPEHSHKH
jgi:hypothetical protein